MARYGVGNHGLSCAGLAPEVDADLLGVLMSLRKPPVLKHDLAVLRVVGHVHDLLADTLWENNVIEGVLGLNRDED